MPETTHLYTSNLSLHTFRNSRVIQLDHTTRVKGGIHPKSREKSYVHPGTRLYDARSIPIQPFKFKKMLPQEIARLSHNIVQSSSDLSRASRRNHLPVTLRYFCS